MLRKRKLIKGLRLANEFRKLWAVIDCNDFYFSDTDEAEEKLREFKNLLTGRLSITLVPGLNIEFHDIGRRMHKHQMNPYACYYVPGVEFVIRIDNIEAVKIIYFKRPPFIVNIREMIFGSDIVIERNYRLPRKLDRYINRWADDKIRMAKRTAENEIRRMNEEHGLEQEKINAFTRKLLKAGR